LPTEIHLKNERVFWVLLVFAARSINLHFGGTFVRANLEVGFKESNEEEQGVKPIHSKNPES
jgi:hypothetical protein